MTVTVSLLMVTRFSRNAGPVAVTVCPAAAQPARANCATVRSIPFALLIVISTSVDFFPCWHRAAPLDLANPISQPGRFSAWAETPKGDGGVTDGDVGEAPMRSGRHTVGGVPSCRRYLCEKPSVSVFRNATTAFSS